MNCCSRVTLILFLAFATKSYAQVAASAGTSAPDEAITLSPFTVEGSQDVGYLATSTLAGTRLNTNLKDVGAAVSVYTQEFLADINAQSIEDILGYTVSTEGGGINGNYSGITGASSDGVRDDPSSINRVRGLASATRTRGYFASDLPSDSYNFNTVTISRGPNAALAGIGNAGGIIDVSLRQATFKDTSQYVLRLGDYGSNRQELHMNQVLIKDRLAVRADLLDNNQIFRQDPAHNRDRRAYAAMTLVLRDPKRDSFLGRTTIRANAELGKIQGVPPNQLTPALSMASWFDNSNPQYDKWGVNGALQKIYDSSGNVVPATGTGIVSGFPLYRQWALIYADPTSGQAGVGFPQSNLAKIQGFQGTIPGAPTGPGGYLRSTGDIDRLRPGYSATYLTAPGMYNFYDHLLTGGFDLRKQHFDAENVRLEQLLMNGDAGFELAFDNQDFVHTRDFPITGSTDDITIDTNEFLSVRSTDYPNGIPNPNFGRPFIFTNDAFNDQWNRSRRISDQATAFIQHEFFKKETLLGKLIGQNTLSGLLFHTKISSYNRTYGSTWDPFGQLNPLASTGSAPGLFGSQVSAWFYLGPSLVNTPSLSDVRLQSISGARPQMGQNYTLQVYDPTSRSFVTGTTQPLRILKNLNDQEQDINARSLTLQSRWLEDYVTTIVGWRKDSDETFVSSQLPPLPNGNLDLSKYHLVPAVAEAKDSWTKSVVAHVPPRYLAPLHWAPDIRVYWNNSDNFNPVGPRRDIYNENLGSPSASTTEYGTMLSWFQGKVDLRINHFETRIKDASVPGVASPLNYISAMIQRSVSANQLNLNPADFGYNYPGLNTFEDVARAFYSTIPKELIANSGLANNFAPYFYGTGPTFGYQSANIQNYASTSDTVSTGMEYEAVVNPTHNWRIAFNAAEVTAVQANVAVKELAFANEWIANLKSMYGGVLATGARNPPVELLPVLGQYQTETVSLIQTSNALSGTATPEIRKWRFNLVTRYDFDTSFLKGFNVGGALRWQDKVGIGYPYIKSSTGGSVADIAHPYYGPHELNLDFSIGYRRKLNFLKGLLWSIQLNAQNVTANDELIPISANADGTYGMVRIPPNRTWMVTNSLSF